jgi:hypothetical protein
MRGLPVFARRGSALMKKAGRIAGSTLRHSWNDRNDRPYSIKSAAGAVPIARKRSINRRIKKINDSSGVLVEKRFPAGLRVEEDRARPDGRASAL